MLRVTHTVIQKSKKEIKDADLLGFSHYNHLREWSEKEKYPLSVDLWGKVGLLILGVRGELPDCLS